MKILGFPWTIRTRLSLLYAAAFFIACVALIVVIYFSLGQVLDRQFIVRLRDLGAPGELPAPEVMSQLDRVQVLVRQGRLNTLDTMLVASLILVGIMTLVAGGIGWLVAGQALRPLRSITATARRVADRSLHERIALAGPDDEIKHLADTLDAMLERLDRSFDSQRRFVANASHELRTPLTIGRTLIEVALLDPKTDEKVRQLGATLLAVNQRHEKLIEGLLTLASSEQRIVDRGMVELADLAGQVVSELHPLADRASVAIETELRPGIVPGDAFLLERLVQNLVENGIRYNVPQSGWVRVRTDVAPGHVDLVVENTGPVVPGHEVAGLFEPFRRLPGSERLASVAQGAVGRGAGLGLSIVRSVTHAHGGEVQATSRQGGGLVVRVRIPAAAGEPESLTAS